MNSPVSKIKERLNIEDVISSYIKLERVGTSLKARCPFHNEKTPSFFVSVERGSYYCFGCSKGGDIFSFVEEFEGLDFKGALKLLADRAGVPLGEFTKEDKDFVSEKERLYQIMEESTRYFENNLKQNGEVLEYLKNRGLNEKSIKDFRIGYAMLDWRKLYDHLKTKNFKDNDIEQAGLIKKTEKGFYDRFRGRVMFPIADSSGRIIAFSGRIFVDDGKSAKYLNSPETPIFKKSATLYGLDKAKETIRKSNFSILVEGQMDLVLSHQAGYRNTVATSGTALSEETYSEENVVSNLGLIRRLSPNIVLSFDGDKAGFNALNRAAKIALSLGMDVKVVKLDAGMDPADLISKNGDVAWKTVVKNSKHIIEFLVLKILDDFSDDKRKIGKEIKEKVLPFVDLLDSSIEKMFFVKKISDLSLINETAIKKDLEDIKKDIIPVNNILNQKEEMDSVLNRKDYILRKLKGIFLWQSTAIEKSLVLDKLLKEILDILNTTEKDFLESMKYDREELIFEAEVFYEGSDLDKDIRELILNLKEESLKEKLEEKMKELSFIEEGGDVERSAQILKECKILNDQIQDIKNSRK